jgi:hypothetical protein
MPLSEEARRRFASVLDETDRSNTNPADDTALLDFVAWALVHDSDALRERFGLESMMSERGLTDNRMRYVLTILRAAAPLVAAYEREREGGMSTATRLEGPSGPKPDDGG